MTEETPSEGTIRLRLGRIEQLFNSLDPSPFHERDLDPAAEEYIVGWARELPAKADLHILIRLPAEEVQQAGARSVEAALGNYFTYRAELTERDLRELFRMGRRYLAIGLVVLTICLMSGQVLRSAFAVQTLPRLLEESLLILGWVANWKPLETFLYDWWPLRRRLQLYRRLARARTTIRAEGAAAA